VLELPLSSTRMEAMAIITAVAITPPRTPLAIFSDSRAAIHMVKRASAPIATRELFNSPDAFLWLHLRDMLQSRLAPVTMTWVQGHSGDAANEKADRLATAAHHAPSVPRWTTRMPPPRDTPVWLQHDGRVIPRRPRRLLREQDEAITADQLTSQVNAVPGRPAQTPEQVERILQTLRWTKIASGATKKTKCWKITNSRDAHMRAFGYKQLMGFLPTLERQRAWYPDVYDRPALFQCAKCGHAPETPEHIYECADHASVRDQFITSYGMLQPERAPMINIGWLRPWTSLGQLQGRIDPGWQAIVPTLLLLLPGRRAMSAPATIQQLLRASLETWYQAIWLPRCQRTIEQERSEGLHQGAKLRRMRAPRRSVAGAPPSPTPNLPRSFIHPVAGLSNAYSRLMSLLMRGTPRHRVS
jgi:ribonuclease HI